jgi:hypothetical protein
MGTTVAENMEVLHVMNRSLRDQYTLWTFCVATLAKHLTRSCARPGRAHLHSRLRSPEFYPLNYGSGMGTTVAENMEVLYLYLWDVRSR